MKKSLILLTAILLLPALMAVSLDVEKTSSDEVMIMGLDEPGIFSLDITNTGSTDDFLIYTFFGSGYEPEQRQRISRSDTLSLDFKILPPSSVAKPGFMTFQYFIQGSDDSEYDGELMVKVMDMDDAIDLSSTIVDPEENTLMVTMENKVNFNFEKMDVVFSSAFFEFEESFALGPYETKTFEVTVNQDDFKDLSAGFYTISAQVSAKDKITDIEGTIKFQEKSNIEETTDRSGFFAITKSIKHTNKGNVVETVTQTVKKGTIARLFTSISPQPDDVQREGSKIYYSWNKEVRPGEVLDIKIKTNWFLPFLLIFFIGVIVYFVRQSGQTDLKLRKKIMFVKSTGGEFALKVSLMVEAKVGIDNVVVVDKVPSMMKIYPKFGKEEPVKVDLVGKRMDWEFKRLEAGERRLITYVIYSKLGVLGKFALPKATGFFEKESQIHESTSNKVFFVAEQNRD